MPRPHFACSLAIFALTLSASSTTAAQDPSLQESLRVFAADISHVSKALHCPAPGCTFLVTDFVTDDGDTSKFAVRVADVLSDELSKIKSARIVYRSVFREFLQSERFPARVQCEDSVARWLARRFGSNAAIIGKVSIDSSGRGRLTVTVLEPKEKKGKTIQVQTAFDVSVPADELSPWEGLAPLPPPTGPIVGEKVYAAGHNGVTLPNCFRMPNPSYTEDARAVKYSGTVLVDGYIATNGEMQVLRIEKGAPYGLNDHTRETLSTWKCDPATLDGKPVAVIVPLEVSFRLY
jgi:hypothetical protein